MDARLKQEGDDGLDRLREHLGVLEAENAALRARLAALPASPEARFGKLADALPSLMSEGTADGNVFVNRAYQDFTGLPAAALLGMGWQRVAHPDDLARIAPILAEANRSGRDVEYDLRIRRHDGAWRWFLLRCVVLDRVPGEPVRWSCIGIDIHERREAENEIRRSEARLRALAEAAPGLMFERGDTGNSYVNRAYTDYTGLPADMLLGFGWKTVVHPDDLERILHDVAAANRACAPFTCEFRVRRHDGAYRWFLFKSVPLRDSDSGAWRWFGIGVDIHDRIESEAALRESEQRFRTIADAAPIPMWLTGRDGRTEWVNRAWAELTGRGQAAAVGGVRTDWMHPEDVAQVNAAFAEAVARDVPYRVEYRLRAADGSWRIIDKWGVPRHAPDGGLLGFLTCGVDVTDAREAQRSLAFSEETLRLAVETTELGTWDLNLRTDELYWSPRCRAMFGISPDVPVSMADFYAGLHPDDRARTCEIFARAIDPAVRGDYDVEYRTIGREDGIERWVAAKGRALFDRYGRGIRAIGTTLDITARKRAEAELREREAVLRLAAEAAGLGTWSVSCRADGRYPAEHVWNARAREVFGLAPDEPSGAEAFWQHVHPDDIAYVRARYQGALLPERARRYDFEARMIAHDGRLRWVAVSGLVVCDASGRPVKALGTALDMTERRQAEEALRASEESLRRAAADLEQRVAERTAQLAESEARFRAYFEAVADSLFTVEVTPDGEFLHGGYNPHGERRSGYRNADILGRPVAAFMAPEVAAVVDASFRHVCEHGLSRFTRRLPLPGGEGVFDTLMVPIRDSEGRVVRILASSREVTEQVKLEEQLRQTQKMQAIGQLTGGIAHDFNNLLTGIAGSLELLQRDVTSERGLRLLDAARRSAGRGAQLTSQLLAFSRRQQLQPRPTDLNALVRGMAEMLRSTLGGTVQVAADLAPDLPPALADATQIELAILNLAINARDAMPDGGIIRISTASVRCPPPQCAEDPPEGDCVVLAVQDGGSGMSDEVLSRVFEPFFTTKDVGRGSGLGLPQVLGVAKQLGGGVSVQSREGTGTTVAIFLPRAVAGSLPQALATASATAPLPPGLSLLVVDDDADVRNVAVELLETFGCRVLPAGGGAEALALVAGGARVDAAVIDYAMPAMNGAETASRLRRLCPGLPIIFASGYAHEATLQGLGAPIVRKPFTSDDLAAGLRSCLRDAAMRETERV